ncbi:NAD-dependent epimerase/dehydratase family protein [Alsobacter sp. R-9]
MSERILVTGASGFIGRHALGPLVAAGAAVHAVGRHDPGVAGVTFHPADLLDPAALRAAVAGVRPTHVLHCAWVVEHGVFWTSPLNLDWTAATLHLARAAAEAGARRFVGVGTCVEYDWSDGGGRDRAEADALRPATLYGTAKASTAGTLEAFARVAGLGFGWARPFHLFGPGEDERRLVGSIVRAMRAGTPAELGSGRPVRDFLCSVDAGAALAALVLAGHVEGPVNVASGEGIAIADLAREIAGLAGRLDLLRLGARPDPAGEIPRMVAAVGRLRDEVGFRPARSRQDRLAELVAGSG